MIIKKFKVFEAEEQPILDKNEIANTVANLEKILDTLSESKNTIDQELEKFKSFTDSANPDSDVSESFMKLQYSSKDLDNSIQNLSTALDVLKNYGNN